MSQGTNQSNQQHDLNKGRRLGFFEAVLAEAFETLPGTSQMAGIAAIRGVMSPDLFRETWKLLFEKHPLLRCRIDRQEGHLVFVEDVAFEDIEIEVLESPTGNEWMEVLESQVNIPIKHDRTLWQAAFLQPSPAGDPDRWWLMLKINHSISDGRSSSMLIDDFLSVAARLEDGITIDRESLPFPAPVEQSIDTTVTLEDLATLDEELSKALPDPTSWPVDRQAPFDERRVHLRYDRVERALVEALRQRAHDKGTTLQGAIAAATQLATARFLGTTTNIDLGTPTDLRKKCTRARSLHEVSLAVGLVATAQADVAADSDPWMLACQFHDLLEDKLRNVPTWPKDFSPSDVSNMASNWSNLSSSFDHGATITNLGLLDFDKDHGRFSLDQLSFMANVSGGAIPLVVLLLTLPSGELDFTFGWLDPLLSDQSAHQIIDDILTTFTAMAKTL